MPRAPLLAGSRLIAPVLDGDVELVRPPAPGVGIADIGAATRDALRFPLAGEPLEALVPRGGRVTIVLDRGELPFPFPARDPRSEALGAVAAELARIGVPSERQALLVASGLARRPGPREIEARLGLALARRLDSPPLAHDAEDPALVSLGEHEGRPFLVNRALVETDAVVTISAAESVLHGGAGVLLDACDARTQGAPDGEESLLESGGPGWRTAVAVERALASRVPLAGVSLGLAQPRFGGLLRGVPYDERATARLASSPLRRGFSLLPGGLRRALIRRIRPEVGVEAVFAGPPSVAHAESLLRAIEARSTQLPTRLDAIVIGIPPFTPHPPLERPNPLAPAFFGLGLALRLWRDRFPVAEGGSAIILHRLHRRFAHPTQAPYRDFFGALRGGREPEELAEEEEAAARNEQAIAAYREGRACHPLLPYTDWAACAPARRRLGTVLVAGCRDATAARQLGFVPARGLGTALDLARGRSHGTPAVGCLLAPPYFPLTTRA